MRYHWLLLIIINHYCWLSLIIIYYHWLLLIIIDCHGLSLIIVDYHWIYLITIDFHWLSFIIIHIIIDIIDYYHWLSSIMNNHYWLFEYLERWIAHWLTTWNQEVLAHLKNSLHVVNKFWICLDYQYKQITFSRFSSWATHYLRDAIDLVYT